MGKIIAYYGLVYSAKCELLLQVSKKHFVTGKVVLKVFSNEGYINVFLQEKMNWHVLSNLNLCTLQVKGDWIGNKYK